MLEQKQVKSKPSISVGWGGVSGGEKGVNEGGENRLFGLENMMKGVCMKVDSVKLAISRILRAALGTPQ